MPSPETDILPGPAKAIQYTGSNSADIDAQVPGVTITSEEGGVLTLSHLGNPVTLAVNEWIAWSAHQTFVLTNNQYLAEWGCFTPCEVLEEITELSTVVSEISQVVTQGLVRAMGAAAVPTLLLGQDTTVAVQIQPAMPDSDYTAYATRLGGVNVSDLTITSVTVVDTDTVNVAVDNAGLGTVSGVTVMVHAID